MSTSNEVAALRLALEALEMYCEHGAILRPLETRDAIKEALAQSRSDVKQEQRSVSEQLGEPVAWVHADELEELSHCNGMSVWAENALAHTEDSLSKQLLPSGYVAIYTTPQQRKPLTVEQIAELLYKFESASAWYQFARAIEAAHGITKEDK